MRLIEFRRVHAEEQHGVLVQAALRLRERFMECLYHSECDMIICLLFDMAKLKINRQVLVSQWCQMVGQEFGILAF